MKFLKILPCIALFLMACSQPSNNFNQISQEEWIAKSQPIAQNFGKTLKQELETALGESGPSGAIEVCKMVSKKTEDEFSEQNEEIARIRRITLKTRNPETHTPTEPEKTWLQSQEQIVQNGESPSPHVLVSNDKTTVLFPIVINDPICLVCHGDIQSMPDDFKQTLASNYPNDQATGYQLGDFRGAIAIEWNR